ncbi:glycosyltransferase [Amylibacter sp.]|nr:glycosyltransferase [Amylibacter sp.]
MSLDILHLTSAHPVQDTRIFVKEARALAASGFAVGILGPGDKSDQWDADGVSIHTLPRPSSRKARFSSFAKALFLYSLSLKPKVVHLHDPDLLLLAPKFQRRGVKVVYDVHEEFPKAILSRAWLGPIWIRRIVAKLFDGMEIFALRWLDGVVLADTQLARRFEDANSVVVRNFLDLFEWQSRPSQRAPSGAIRCIYVGDITIARGLDRMCEAIAEVRGRGLTIHLDLIGPISPANRKRVEAHAVGQSITIHGRMSRKQVARSLSQSDIALCLLQPLPAYQEALPVKVLEYFVSCLPVVATDLPRLREEVTLAEGLTLVGWNADDGALGQSIITAVGMSNARRSDLRKSVVGHYNWANEAGKLVAFYQALFEARDAS